MKRMMKKQILETISIFLLCLCCVNVSAQTENYIKKLPVIRSKYKSFSPKNTKKLYEKYASFFSDTIPFENPSYSDEFPEDSKYFSFDINGLYFIDLDADGDLDALYEGITGYTGTRSVQVFIQTNQKFALNQTLKGHILAIVSKPNGTQIYTQSIPCCDSYTTDFYAYQLSSENVSILYCVSAIGIGQLKHFPDFMANMEKDTIRAHGLMAFPLDFRGTSPYFGSNKSTYRDSIRLGKSIPILTKKNGFKARILFSNEKVNPKRYLVMTEPIDSEEHNLFEKAEFKKRYYVGWVIPE